MNALSLEKLAYIIVKAREFDAQVPAEDMEEGSDAADDKAVGILEDTPDNPTREELQSALEDLNEDEMTELLALVWVGRGDYAAETWREALAAARETLDARAVDYLMETPGLGDLLEEGLAARGGSILDEEKRL